jgi:hypothetical protein
MTILFCEVCKHKVIPDNRGQCPQCLGQLEKGDSSITENEKSLETKETSGKE